MFARRNTDDKQRRSQGSCLRQFRWQFFNPMVELGRANISRNNCRDDRPSERERLWLPKRTLTFACDAGTVTGTLYMFTKTLNCVNKIFFRCRYGVSVFVMHVRRLRTLPFMVQARVKEGIWGFSPMFPVDPALSNERLSTLRHSPPQKGWCDSEAMKDWCL